MAESLRNQDYKAKKIIAIKAIPLVCKFNKFVQVSSHKRDAGNASVNKNHFDVVSLCDFQEVCYGTKVTPVDLLDGVRLAKSSFALCI